jgi:hypothetical protein
MTVKELKRIVNSVSDEERDEFAEVWIKIENISAPVNSLTYLSGGSHYDLILFPDLSKAVAQ